MYKYFTWTDRGYHRGQELYSKQQIATLLTHTQKPSECYATIQDYSKEGDTLGCPIYFDIDSLSLEEAYFNMASLTDDLAMDFEVTPAVWFSGSKGFHIVLPLYIRHPRCHEIAGMIAKDYKQETDPAVYRQRSMWRCDKTWNDKGKSYKTRINDEENFGDIVRRSKNNTHLDNWPEWKMRDFDITEYVDKLPKKRESTELPTSGDTIMMPCLKKLWDLDKPPSGQAHQLCHFVSRWCFKSGLNKQEAVSLFDNHKFWRGVNPRDYEKVIDSVYRTGRAHVGCRTGRDAELLEPYCQSVCHFNKDFKLREVFGA